MKSVNNHMVLLFAGMVFSINISAQTAQSGPDSVVFISAKLAADKFTFNDGGTREIRIKDSGAKLAKDKAKVVTRDAGNGFLTIITGIGFGSSNEVNFKVSGSVICNDGLADWKVDLFCEGNQEKSRERVKDDEGWSVETETTNFYYWEKDASGLLAEGDDTLGFFMIVMNPREDSLLKPMTDYYFLPEAAQEAMKPRTMAQFMATSFTQKDYGISGIFRGQPFTIISDGMQKKSWVYFNNQYLFVFFAGNLMPERKKDMIPPYLLIQTDDSVLDRRDFFRLAMVCRYLNSTVGF